MKEILITMYLLNILWNIFLSSTRKKDKWRDFNAITGWICALILALQLD